MFPFYTPWKQQKKNREKLENYAKTDWSNFEIFPLVGFYSTAPNTSWCRSKKHLKSYMYEMILPPLSKTCKYLTTILPQWRPRMLFQSIFCYRVVLYTKSNGQIPVQSQQKKAKRVTSLDFRFLLLTLCQLYPRFFKYLQKRNESNDKLFWWYSSKFFKET